MRSSTGSRLPAADKAASVLAKILAAASSKTKIGKVWRTFSTYASRAALFVGVAR